MEEIYQAYPRKKAPIDAKKAIAKHLGILAKRGTPEPAAWLLGRVLSYAKSRHGEDAQYTPYPASWFNAGRYDEDFGSGGAANPQAPVSVTVADLEAFIASDPDHECFRPILQSPPDTVARLPVSVRESFTIWKVRQKEADLRSGIDRADFRRWLLATFPKVDPFSTLESVTNDVIKEYRQRKP